MWFEHRPPRGQRMGVWKDWMFSPLRSMPDLFVEFGSGLHAAIAMSRATEFQSRVRTFQKEFLMAARKVRESWQTEWVHVDMTPDQKGEYQAWDFETDDVVEALAAFLSSGHKLVVNFNAQNDTYQASLICNGEKMDNEGKGVSGYAKDCWSAIRVLMYKVSVILPDKWSDYVAPGGDEIG